MTEGIELWWDSVKGSDSWSGAIVDLKWEELWPHAKDDLREIFNAAISAGNNENRL